jgi:CheY-like chemotaxis protein
MAAAPGRAVAAMSAQPETPLRIFVVEDSSFVLLGLEAVFDHLGWLMVGPATRRHAGLAMAATEAFDVALLDVNLDGEMSWEVAAVLRERGIPIVFGTGYNVQTVLPEAFRGTPILSKPFSLEELEQTLREAVAGRR